MAKDCLTDIRKIIERQVKKKKSINHIKLKTKINAKIRWKDAEKLKILLLAAEPSVWD